MDPCSCIVATKTQLSYQMKGKEHNTINRRLSLSMIAREDLAIKSHDQTKFNSRAALFYFILFLFYLTGANKTEHFLTDGEEQHKSSKLYENQFVLHIL